MRTEGQEHSIALPKLQELRKGCVNQQRHQDDQVLPGCGVSATPEEGAAHEATQCTCTGRPSAAAREGYYTLGENIPQADS